MHRKHPPLVSIVVPVYNEAPVIQEFHSRVSNLSEHSQDFHIQIIYVNDGSTDGSQQLLHDIAQLNENVVVIKLSRNFGHQPALCAGLDYANGDAVVFIDADLQDPPELIPQMVDLWQEGFDVVSAQRKQRPGESPVKLATASLFYRLINMISQIQIPLDAGDFRLISRNAADHIRSMREQDRFMRGLSSWVGFSQTTIPYDRDERFAGTTKYSYKSMFKFAIDGIISFSTAPLKLATWFGFGSAFLAFVLLALVLVQRLVGYTTQGWTTIMVAILFIGGVQLICLGIIGEYIGRILTQVKGRPIYIVGETLGLKSAVLPDKKDGGIVKGLTDGRREHS